MDAEAQELPCDAVFAAVPAPLLVLTPELTICAANDAYLRTVGRARTDLLGRFLFDVFPEPDHPENGGTGLVRAPWSEPGTPGSRDDGAPALRHPGAGGAGAGAELASPHAGGRG